MVQSKQLYVNTERERKSLIQNGRDGRSRPGEGNRIRTEREEAMRKMTLPQKKKDVICMLWIAICFSLTSGVYLSWLYRLIDLAGSGPADWISMVAGYLLQAAGTGIVMLLLRRNPAGDLRRLIPVSVFLLIVAAFPAILSGDRSVVIVSGLAVNCLSGVISGCYLWVLAVHTGKERRGIAFGAGYGISSIAVFLLSLVGKGGFLRNRHVLLIYILFAAAAAAAAEYFLSGKVRDGEEASPDERETDAGINTSGKALPARILPAKELLFVLLTVFLISLVKNLGFGFPSSDIMIGLSPEFARIFYAAGLIAAGFITDRDRRIGAVCTVAALAVPFIMLIVADEPVEATVCWSIDYLFFGFFSVFRVVIFTDLCDADGSVWLAPAGLFAGRLGDVAGTAVCLWAGGHRIFLISVTAAFFIAAVFCFFVLYRILFGETEKRTLTEQERFELFCTQYELSLREREVLRLLVAEKANSAIAGELYISESTVKFHVHNILKKTGCKGRAELLSRYYAAGV